jgi:putative membrane protein
VQWWCAATGAAWDWRWIPYPGVWAFLLTLTGSYAAVVRGVRSAGTPVPLRKPAFFFAGLLALWVALDWPVGPLGAGYLASVHMGQFLLIAMLAPPLLLHGIPEAAYRRIESHPVALRILAAVTHPVVAMAIFTVSMAATHWPPVVDSLMGSQLGSFAIDMVWLATGLIFSWPVAAPVPERPWMTGPVKMGHLLAGSLLNTGVFAFLTFSDLPVYAIYELAPPISGLTSREDQRIAGLLMKMGGAPIMWSWISILFFRWYRESESASDEPDTAPPRPDALAQPRH